MSDDTPTTGDVRREFGKPWEEGRLAAFDRWLAQHDREVAAAAWQEGAEAVARATLPGADPLTNPYKEGA